MKKAIVILLAVAAFSMVSLSISDAFDQAFAPSDVGIPNPDDILILNRFDLDGFAHAVISFNNTEGTAFAVVLDPDGNPDFFSPVAFGYAYLWADILYDDLYGSNDGLNWFFIGKI